MRTSILVSSMILILAVPAPAEIPDPMILIPAGSFVMGDGIAYCGTDEREVTLTNSFHLGQHEVTNQQYLEALQWAHDQGYVTATPAAVFDQLDGSAVLLVEMGNIWSEIQFDGAGTFYLVESTDERAVAAYPDGYDPAPHPVKMVNWFGAARYCDWLSLQENLPRAYEHSGDWACNSGNPYGAAGYRLPTDAEWEYAAQFDDERIYPWGNETPTCELANFNPTPAGHCVGWSSPVGSYAGQAWGLWDMAGNMFEMCNDWYVCSLGTEPVTDPIGPAGGTQRVGGRGGDWWWANQFILRLATRVADASATPYSCWNNVGFRVAKTAAVTGAQPELETEPSQLLLEPLQPNPFTMGTRVTYTVPGGVETDLAVYDALGRRLRTLIKATQPAGTHHVSWDGTDDLGSPVAAGVYFCRLRTGTQTATRQVQLLR